MTMSAGEGFETRALPRRSAEAVGAVTPPLAQPPSRQRQSENRRRDTLP
jgi:hypothetical protein